MHLVTTRDEFKGEQQDEYLAQTQAAVEVAGIHFTWEYDASATIHARHIVTDNGWKILLDRGLDVFQRYEMNDAFDLGNRVQRCPFASPHGVREITDSLRHKKIFPSYPPRNDCTTARLKGVALPDPAEVNAARSRALGAPIRFGHRRPSEPWRWRCPSSEMPRKMPHEHVQQLQM